PHQNSSLEWAISSQTETSQRQPRKQVRFCAFECQRRCFTTLNSTSPREVVSIQVHMEWLGGKKRPHDATKAPPLTRVRGPPSPKTNHRRTSIMWKTGALVSLGRQE